VVEICNKKGRAMITLPFVALQSRNLCFKIISLFSARDFFNRKWPDTQNDANGVG
jgi:hypothetical protein